MSRLTRLRRWLRWHLAYANFLEDLKVDPNPRFGDLVKQQGVAFVHIPKTGGTSVSTALYGEAIGHRTWDQIRNVDPSAFETWLKLAVVREPLDRFISAYDYLASGGNNEFDRHFSRRFVNVDIDSFAKKLLVPEFRVKVMKFWHFRPQVDFVIAADGLVMVDRLIPFERIADAMEELGITKLPRLNTNAGGRSPRSKLTTAAVEAIANVYAEDFALCRLAQSGTSLYRTKLPRT